MKIPAAPRTEDELELSKWRWNLTKYLEQIGDHELFLPLRTTDATIATLGSITLDDESAYFVEAIIVAKQEGSGNRAAYIRRVLVFRNGAGATITGSVSAVETIESDAAWDATLDVSGNDVRIRVTGKAATTIDWKAILKYLAVKPARL